tara:strand:- start:31 stop:225 length:195 start_codon:yes stop_codon:yes gene_type:complete
VCPAPPPVDVIVEKVELIPLVPGAVDGIPHVDAPVPPLPTVIGKAVAVTVTAVPPGLPFNGLAV